MSRNFLEADAWDEPLVRAPKKYGSEQGRPKPQYSLSRPKPDDAEIKKKELQELRERFITVFKNSISGSQLPEERRALVIAITYSGNPPGRLFGTYVDALRIVQMLEQRFKYPKSSIRILSDIFIDDANGKRDWSRWPSKDNIEQCLEWLVSGSRKDDYRFLFYAGHGHRLFTKSGLSVEGIIPEDVVHEPCSSCGNPETSMPNPRSVLWDYKFNDILAESLGDGAKLTVVFDCCHSGGTLGKTNPDALDLSNNMNVRPGIFDLFSTTQPEGVCDQNNDRALTSSVELTGNMLVLPQVADLGAEQLVTTDFQRPRVPEEQRNCPKGCVVLLDNVKEPTRFRQGCRVMCWASSDSSQFSFEYSVKTSPKLGGIFSEAFTNHLNTQDTNYRKLNRHIDQQLKISNDMRKNNTDYKMGKSNMNWDRVPDNEKYQHAKLFTSANMGDGTGDNQFEYPVDL